MRLKKAARIVLIASLAGAFLIFIFILSVWFGAFGSLKSENELRAYENATASIVLASNGEVIGRFFSENRTNTSFERLPKNLVDALIATEDVRFFKHHGIDTKSLLRVLIKSIIISDRSSGGGSTITQQLAKNMYGRSDNGILTLPVNKTKEIILARRLEKIFSKEQILTLYLNTVSFGENVYGIEAASGRYFNKKVEDLKVEESAVLIGMLKANTYYNPRINPDNSIKRRNVVIRQMARYGFLGSREADSITSLPLKLDYVNIDYEGPADYFLVQVKNEARRILKEAGLRNEADWNIEQDGLLISTTLNLQLQDYALDAIREHLSGMQKRLRDQYNTQWGKKILHEIVEREIKRFNLGSIANKKRNQQVFDWKGSYTDSISIRDSLRLSMTLLHAGVMILDPVSGAVRTWIGGIDFRTQPYDQVTARRQIASTFKPVLYTAALERGIDPCTYLDNDSVTVTGLEDWSPHNFDYTTGGKYSLAGALIHSMNIPSFNLYLNTPFEEIDTIWQRMGFAYPLFNHPSLPFGTSEASVREVASGFSSFANGGYRINPYLIDSISDYNGKIIWKREDSKPAKRIMSERTNLIMNSILQRAINEGTGSAIRGRFGVTIPLAGKTGTSQDYADAWFTAWNPGMIIVCRVGASSPAIHFLDGSFGSGSALALPIVGLTLKKLQKERKMPQNMIADFPDLPPELQDALDCPDFREDNLIDKFMNVIRKDEVIYDQETGKAVKKRRSFFRRLFGR
jgi:penicillin-binding protein 1A